MSVVLALAAAFFYALGNVLQHAAAAAQPPGAPLLPRLMHNSRWLGGNAVNALGWLLQAVALSQGELLVVQPLLLCSILFSLPLTSRLRGRPLPRGAWMGAAATAGGIALFLWSAHPQAGVGSVSERWPLAFAAVAVAALGTLGLQSLIGRASSYGVASGLLFGAAAAATKATVSALGLGLFTSWPLYMMAGTTFSAFYLAQKAYQSGAMTASFPALIALDPLVSSLLGVVLFGEYIDTSGMAVALEAGGISMMAAGLVLLSGGALDETQKS